MNAFTKQCIETTTVLILGRAHHWPIALRSQLNTELINRVIKPLHSNLKLKIYGGKSSITHL